MTRYAFLIGCEEYKNFDRAYFCESDVGLVQETLVEYCDYELKNIERSYQYEGCDDTPTVIYKKLHTIVNRAQEGDSILFYFAGHGKKEEEKGYLLLADSKISDLQNTALDMAKINDLLNKSHLDSFMVLDACHSGILARNVLNSFVVDNICDTGCVTLASCSENEESNPYIEKEQGVFTYYFCDEIKKLPEGSPVFVEALKLGVCKSVSEWAQNNYKHQTPTLNGQIVGNKTIAFRNEKIYLPVKDDFKTKLLQLENDFFERCYCANLELGYYNADDILDNYALAQELCWDLYTEKDSLVDDWQDILVKLMFYSLRLKENKNINMPLIEQNEILHQIRTFVESIPIEFEN